MFWNSPPWTQCFDRLGLREEALKCRFLQAHALKEMDHLLEAKLVFKQIKENAYAEHFDRHRGALVVARFVAPAAD